MARNPRRLWWAALSIGGALMLSGCWDVETPEVLTVPVMMAIDWRHQTYRVTIEADAPDLLQSPGQSNSSGSSRPTWILQGQGPSVAEALLHTGLNAPTLNPLTLTHLRVLILGQSALSPKAMPGIWDWLSRSPYLHRTFWVLATSGPASRIAETTNPLGPDPVTVLEQEMKDARVNGWIAPIRFYRLTEIMTNAPGSAQLIPLVTLKAEPGVSNGTNFTFDQGADVLSPTRLVGRWTPSQVMTYNLLTNRRPHVFFRLCQDGQCWTVGTITSRTRILLTGQGIEATSTVQIGLLEHDGSGRTQFAPLWLEHAAAAQLSRQMFNEIRWTQAHRVDLFGLSTQEALWHPVWFNRHANQWMTRYAQLPLKVHVTVILHGTGNLQPPSPH